jgi:hypothetical protein
VERKTRKNRIFLRTTFLSAIRNSFSCITIACIMSRVKLGIRSRRCIIATLLPKISLRCRWLIYILLYTFLQRRAISLRLTHLPACGIITAVISLIRFS